MKSIVKEHLPLMMRKPPSADIVKYNTITRIGVMGLPGCHHHLTETRQKRLEMFREYQSALSSSFGSALEKRGRMFMLL